MEEPLKNAEKMIRGYVQKTTQKTKMREDQAQAVLVNIMYTMDYHHIKNRDLLIEAATESIPSKQKIFDYNITILPRIRDQIEITEAYIQQT